MLNSVHYKQMAMITHTQYSGGNTTYTHTYFMYYTDELQLITDKVSGAETLNATFRRESSIVFSPSIIKKIKI